MSKEAMKLVLEKIATVNAMDYEYQAWAREALAKQEQGEPVVKYSDIVSDGGLDPRNKFDTTPQQRKPLTDEQIAEAVGWVAGRGCKPLPIELQIARAIEAAHGIKE